MTGFIESPPTVFLNREQKLLSLSSVLVGRLMLNVRNPRLLEETSIEFEGSAIVETRIFFTQLGEGDNLAEIPDE